MTKTVKKVSYVPMHKTNNRIRLKKVKGKWMPVRPINNKKRYLSKSSYIHNTYTKKYTRQTKKTKKADISYKFGKSRCSKYDKEPYSLIMQQALDLIMKDNLSIPYVSSCLNIPTRTLRRYQKKVMLNYMEKLSDRMIKAFKYTDSFEFVFDWDWYDIYGAERNQKNYVNISAWNKKVLDNILQTNDKNDNLVIDLMLRNLFFENTEVESVNVNNFTGDSDIVDMIEIVASSHFLD